MEYNLLTNFIKYGKKIRISVLNNKLILTGPLGSIEKYYNKKNINLLRRNIVLVKKNFYFAFLKELEKLIIGITYG